MDPSDDYLDFGEMESLMHTERRDPGVAAGRERSPMAVKAAARVIRSVAPGGRIVQLYPVWRVSRFQEEWGLRRVRARHERDLPQVVLASTLLDAVERVPRGWLVAGELDHDGEALAVFVDADRAVWLGVCGLPNLVLLGP
ncbi:MAG: hypothetical protein ACI8PZ_001008 [Myxococcota bacterium]|jgi:hypothetical protein